MVLFRSQVELLSINPDLELTHYHCVVVVTKEAKNHLFNKHINSMVVKDKVGRFYSPSLHLYNLQLVEGWSSPQTSKKYRSMTNKY